MAYGLKASSCDPLKTQAQTNELYNTFSLRLFSFQFYTSNWSNFQQFLPTNNLSGPRLFLFSKSYQMKERIYKKICYFFISNEEEYIKLCCFFFSKKLKIKNNK